MRRGRLKAALRAVRGHLRFRLRRRRLAAAGEIRVLLVDGWGDGARALADMTPGGSGRVGPVHFAFAHGEEPHYTLVLSDSRHKSFRRPRPPGRLWYILGEPPVERTLDLIRQPPSGARVYAVPAFLALRDDIEARPSHCLLRTWHVGRGLEALRAMPLPSDKPHALSWITSALDTLPGHRKRLAFLARLRAELPFDLWGRGFTPIEDKWDGLAAYRYSVAFENSRYPGYFTEKLADPILAGCLPFYYGCPDVERWLPAGAFLRFDPDDPLVFDRMRDWLASDLWRERRPALEEAKALLLERYNTFAYLAREFEADFPRRFRARPRRSRPAGSPPSPAG